MDEEIKIIDSNTRYEKIKYFFEKNKKNLISIIIIIIILLISYFSFDKIKKRNKIKLANQYNSILIDYDINKKEKSINELIEIVNKKDTTYSPLALYFIIDNNLVKNKKDINNLFDIVIDKTSLELEIKNLAIYKKALYNSDSISENQLIQILKPIINSESVWKSHALYLLAEYFYFNNEREKAREFFNQILVLPNSNPDIKLESQKRLNRDLSE
jgi:predicted negative regulator of RcsB-dependent stress response